MENFKIQTKDVTFNKNVSVAKAAWFCENYETIITGLETAKLFFKNPIVKMVLNLCIGAVGVVAQTICGTKRLAAKKK